MDDKGNILQTNSKKLKESELEQRIQDSQRQSIQEGLQATPSYDLIAK